MRRRHSYPRIGSNVIQIERIEENSVAIFTIHYRNKRTYSRCFSTGSVHGSRDRGIKKRPDVCPNIIDLCAVDRSAIGISAESVYLPVVEGIDRPREVHEEWSSLLKFWLLRENL